MNYAEYNILIVDDTPNNLDVLVDFLQAYGFGLRIARTGETAIQRVLYDAPDIILLDVLLPGMDGFETCRQLKENPTTSNIPIIFMTSLANAEDKVRGFEAGAVDYVTKPLQQAEVLARITTHLRQRDLAQDLQAQYDQLQHSSRVERERLLEAVDEQRTQLRALTTRLTDIQEQERRRLSRELHDELGQALTAIRMNLAAIEKGLSDNSSPDAAIRVQERLTEAAQLTDETLEQIRELSLELRPSMLDDLGLLPTLSWYVNRFSQRMNIPVDFQTAGFDEQDRVPSVLETALYRILQEALTNVARHANASRVRLSLAIEAPIPINGSAKTSLVQQDVIAVIEDDGCGFEPELTLRVPMGLDSNQHGRTHQAKGGMGLLGMRERVQLLGGTWNISTALQAGTMIRIQIPISDASIMDPNRNGLVADR